MRREIHHFFEIYKDLEPGKRTEALGWDDREAGEREISESLDRFREHKSRAAGAQR
jgi:inorganic pyrophosphatase